MLLEEIDGTRLWFLTGLSGRGGLLLGHHLNRLLCHSQGLGWLNSTCLGESWLASLDLGGGELLRGLVLGLHCWGELGGINSRQSWRGSKDWLGQGRGGDSRL